MHYGACTGKADKGAAVRGKSKGTSVSSSKKAGTLVRHSELLLVSQDSGKCAGAALVFCTLALLLEAGTGEGSEQQAQWVQVGSFAPAPFDADRLGVSSYMCREATWAVPWADVLAQHRDNWGSVTLKLRLESPLKSSFRSHFEVVWRQPATDTPCYVPAPVHGGDPRFQREARASSHRQTADLLGVRSWDGHDSTLLVAFSNVWPFASVWTSVLVHGEHAALGAELWVCPRCRIQSSLWHTVEEACANAKGDRRGGERDWEGGGGLADVVDRNPFLAARLCSSTAPADAREEPHVVSPVHRLYAIMWEYLVAGGANTALRARMNQQLAVAFQAADSGAMTDGVTLLLLAHYMPLSWEDKSPFVRPLDQERALRTALRLAPSLAVEAHAALAMRYIGRGHVRESLVSLSLAASALPDAVREGVLVNMAVGVARMVFYAQAQEPLLLPSAVLQIAKILNSTPYSGVV
jgi:hypothetical protein